ncbi:MAG: hypothetical protein LUD07_02660 [Clostridiales bacterium]|nr:hypothetical protein [Clostridiales bacterium]
MSEQTTENENAININTNIEFEDTVLKTNNGDNNVMGKGHGFFNKFHRKKRIRYQGPEYELYVNQKNLWICIAIVSTGIPYIIPFLVAFMSGIHDYASLFRNGELVLSAMALISPFLFEIFSKKSFEKAWKSYLFCVVMWIIQTSAYVVIRHNNIIQDLNGDRITGMMNDSKILFLSIMIVLGTFICCCHSLHTLYFICSDADIDKGGQS